MQLKQIVFKKENINNEYVTYENALKPKIVFSNNKLRDLFDNISEELFLKIDKLLEEYLNNEELCNNDDGFFPQPKYMTGEWYLSKIYMDEDYLSVETCFIGTDTGKKDDYLGLEVCFYFDKEKGIWLFDSINSVAL
ncbi:MAG: hypothetical protein J6A58_12210 [Oscillospiraceae bacterium]|nr:hypothetical protein [Oscillospiraceae bacterium]